MRFCLPDRATGSDDLLQALRSCESHLPVATASSNYNMAMEMQLASTSQAL